MAQTVAELMNNLKQLEPHEIIIGLLFTAQDFESELEDLPEEQVTEVMTEASDIYENDGITREMWGWLGDTLSNIVEKKKETN